jgi:hypothetical protein
MIQIFVGDDTIKAKQALENAISKVSNSEEVNLRRFNDIAFSLIEANEAVFEQNLFGGKNIIVFEGILDIPEGVDFYASNLVETTNSVYIRETAPNKEILDKFKKIGSVHLFDKVAKTQQKPLSFAVADAYAQRDKKKAWVLYRNAVSLGAVGEELHGTLFWVAKLLLCAGTLSREEAIASGVNAGNYYRYLEWSKKYSKEELYKKLRDLKNMYHEAHNGFGELANLLEIHILNI